MVVWVDPLKVKVGMNRYATFWKGEIIWLEWWLGYALRCFITYFGTKKETNSTGEEFMKKKIG